MNPINFGLGQPSPSLLPLEAIERAAGAAFRAQEHRLVLQYGRSRGTPDVRNALAQLIERQGATGRSCDPEGFVITSGISSALSMVAQVFVERGRSVACGDPTYFLARGIFETARIPVLGIPVDDGGLIVDALAQALEGGASVDLVYCIPAFHNPTSVCLDPVRARRLVDLAETFDFVIAADEPYGLLGFEAQPPSLLDYDEGRGRVLSLGSFSKILGPGLRLGWVQAEAVLLERLLTHGTFRSGGGLNPIVAAIVHRVIDEGFLDEHVGMLRRTLSARASTLAGALERELPTVAFRRAEGGYFLWIDLGEGRDADRIAQTGRDAATVTFTPASRCTVSRQMPRHARLSFAFYEEHELEEGVRRLAHHLAVP